MAAGVSGGGRRQFPASISDGGGE
ncbi:uncharacterized protein G2W53_010665 [Senna tora]|uniref:Uncharacterized protein n=1 Tax=Senna tora TaxID=362788 RepID=A0A834X0A2_9FABA|nr:uncharacterized protein G2W53_010665 [Senna tora]